MNPVSKYRPLKHYQWGDHCQGWNLVDNEQLCIKQELMPPGTSEARHYHQRAQQFFYILKGEASFEVQGSELKIKAGEGLHIEAGIPHRILNTTGEDLEFLLCSHPTTNNDRFNCSSF
jgi:mannose-6-phosphate isomerase-like protein (cupin superfamily)